jgi:tRNA threonylcarbamoyl adenosine modification protein (Sua5/YciO/YrdC/YwlC family)
VSAAGGADPATFERCIAVGGVAVFPSDTVYGLACDPQNPLAVERLYRLKRRNLGKPSAVMFFELDLALSALPELGARTRNALARLLPGPVTVLLPNPAGRFPLACGDDLDTLGVRVPMVAALREVRWPILQSSANLAGGAEARRLDAVPERIRREADLLVDGGELPGTASTVVDLRGYEDDGEWAVVREGALPAEALRAALAGQFHFHADTYGEDIRAEIPVYDRLQDEVVLAGGTGAWRILELGTGTGETTQRLLERHPDAQLVGIDEDPSMLEAARDRVAGGGRVAAAGGVAGGGPVEGARVDLRVARLQDELPSGPFELVASALCVHHLDGDEKQDLFSRVRSALGDGGRFVLGDVVVPERAQDAITALTAGYDRPSSVPDQVRWLEAAGFLVSVVWEHRDLAVLVAVAV